MIIPKTLMRVKYVDIEGNEHTAYATDIVFGCGFLGDQCEITDEDGLIVCCDTSALLEIRLM